MRSARSWKIRPNQPDKDQQNFRAREAGAGTAERPGAGGPLAPRGAGRGRSTVEGHS